MVLKAVFFFIAVVERYLRLFLTTISGAEGNCSPSDSQGHAEVLESLWPF